LLRGIVFFRRVHVEHAQTVRVEAADFVFMNLAGADLVVEKNRPQLAALQLCAQQRRAAGSVNGV
jgi:hypothetical protein